MRKVIDDTQAIASVWDSLVFRTFRTCVYVHVCCNLFRRERFAATRPWFLSVLPRLLPFVMPERGPYVVAVLGSRSLRIR